MSTHRFSRSLAAATAALCLSGAGAANAQITATTTKTNVLCNGGSNGGATVTATGGSGNYDYSWAPSGGTAATISGRTAGTYTVTITESGNPLVFTTANVTITEPAVLSATTTKTDATSAGGTDGQATVTPTGGTTPYSYSWSPTGGPAATATGLSPDSYTVTVTDNNNCTTQSTAIVGVSAAAPAAVPTLSEWAIILMTGLLALLGAARLGLLPSVRKH